MKFFKAFLDEKRLQYLSLAPVYKYAADSLHVTQSIQIWKTLRHVFFEYFDSSLARKFANDIWIKRKFLLVFEIIMIDLSQVFVASNTVWSSLKKGPTVQTSIHLTGQLILKSPKYNLLS